MTDSDEDDFIDNSTSTRARIRDVTLSIPTGHVLVNRKWAGSSIIPSLIKVLAVRYDTSLDIADFQPAANMLVMFLSEPDIISGVEAQASKMSKLTAMSERKRNLSVIWIYLKSELTSQYLQEFQQKIVLEMSNTLIPVSSHDQLGQILQQLQLSVSRANPFKPSKQGPLEKSKRLHKDILHTVLKLPGMGEKKSRSLLEKFDTIQKISGGSQQELSGVLGHNLARGVHQFFLNKSS